MSSQPAWPSSGGPVGGPRPVSQRRSMPRPIYREPLPARAGSVLLGVGAGAFWMLLFGLLAHNARGYVWWTVAAGIGACAAALVLVRLGDRGVAAGVAIASGLGVAIAFSVVMVDWIHGTWILW